MGDVFEVCYVRVSLCLVSASVDLNYSSRCCLLCVFVVLGVIMCLVSLFDFVLDVVARLMLCVVMWVA